MQVRTSLQTENHASTPPLNFLQVGALRVANQQRQSTEGKVGRHFLSLKKQPLFTFRTCSLAATIVKDARRPS